jgi:hypothetical protein
MLAFYRKPECFVYIHFSFCNALRFTAWGVLRFGGAVCV